MKKTICIVITLLYLSCKTTNPMNYSIEYNIEKNEIADLKFYIPDLTDQKFYSPIFCIDLEIQGKKYPFIVDTGDKSGTLRLSRKIMDQLQSRELNKTTTDISFYGNNKSIAYSVSDVKIGDITINDLECYVTEDSWFEPISSYIDNIGYIGWGLLREFNVLFDYPNSNLKLYKKGYLPEYININEGSSYIETNKLFYITGKFENNKKYDLLIDSGAANITRDKEGDFILMDSLFRKSYSSLSKKTITEADYLIQTINFENISLSNVKFGNLDAPWFLTYKFEGMLGAGFFSQNSIFFDTESNRMYILNR